MELNSAEKLLDFVQTLYRICKNWKWFHFIFYFVRFNLLQISKLPNRIGNLMLFAAEDLLKNGFKSDILWILNELCVSSSSLLCFSPTSSMKVDADTNKILNSLKNVKICHIQSNIYRLYITRKKMILNAAWTLTIYLLFAKQNKPSLLNH